MNVLADRRVWSRALPLALLLVGGAFRTAELGAWSLWAGQRLPAKAGSLKKLTLTRLSQEPQGSPGYVRGEYIGTSE